MPKTVDDDFLNHYKIITTKLRKRFLRKPNVAEASEEFSALALQSERALSLEFSSLCWLGTAKCEGSLGSSYSEIEALLRAARLFIKSDILNQSIGCPLSGNENINAALNCYHHAISRFRENSPTCTAAHIEAKKALGDQITRDIDCEIIKKFNPILTLHILSSKADNFIKNEDYFNALQVLTEMDASISSSAGVYRDILIKNEITKLLLLLLLEPSVGKLTVLETKLIEKYSWTDFDNTNEGIHVSSDLALHLHALVAAWQSKDALSMSSIRPKLANYMTVPQKNLLANLVKKNTFIC